MTPADRQLSSSLGRRVPSAGAGRPELERRAWIDHGCLVIRVDDQRLTWLERELVRQLGERLWGRRVG